MEKYSRWRDAGTGIQPFLPPVPPRTDKSLLTTLSNVIHLIVGPIQGLIKILLVASITLLYIVFVPVLGTLLKPIQPIHRAWTSLFSFIFLRLILLLMGFFHIKAESVSLRKSRTGGVESINNKKVIIANWTSYIDIIYLAAKYNPTFTQVYLETDRVKVIGLWQAIRLVGKVPEVLPAKGEYVYSVHELASKTKGPIVVFAEGATTNGRALLKFAPLFNDYQQEDDHFQIIAFKYEYGNMPPTYTVGNQFIHFFKLCSQFHNTLIVKSLAPGESALGGADVTESLLSALGNISKLRKTNLSMADKKDFLIYFASRQKK